MLIVLAKIIFFKPQKNISENDGFSATNILRPAFNFGCRLLFSGTIQNENGLKKYKYNETYEVIIEFPTIDNEAYKIIKPLLCRNLMVNIQNASKIIGKAILLEFEYKT